MTYWKTVGTFTGLRGRDKLPLVIQQKYEMRQVEVGSVADPRYEKRLVPTDEHRTLRISKSLSAGVLE